VFTQVWLMMAIGFLLKGSEDGAAVMASVGFNVCMMWYGANILALGEKVPQRAMHGWTRWLLENFFGDILQIYLPHWDKGGQVHKSYSYVSVAGSFPLGFLAFDIAFHFVPCVAVLQQAAALITLRHVVLGYLGARVMALFVTAHHWNFDWAHIYRRRRLRIYSTSESRITAWPCSSVISSVYGLEPPPGERFFHLALVLEAVGTLIMAGIVSLPQDHKTEVLFTLGLGHLFTVSQLWMTALGFFLFGLVLMLSGAALARSRMPPHHRNVKGRWARLDDGFGEYAEIPIQESKKIQ